MSSAESERAGEEATGPTIRDRRRIDPETFQVREPAAAEAAAAGPADPAADQALAELTTQLGERTADLQRLQAEYVNYKRRVDRDRDVARKAGVEAVLRDLMSVLDHIGSARQHDELTGGFKAVAEEIEKVAERNGLEQFGTKGEPFDPHVHEALMHAHAADVAGPTCVEIFQPGYRVGDRVLRPARVAVAEPDPSAPAAPAGLGQSEQAQGEPGQSARAQSEQDQSERAQSEQGRGGSGSSDDPVA